MLTRCTGRLQEVKRRSKAQCIFLTYPRTSLPPFTSFTLIFAPRHLATLLLFPRVLSLPHHPPFSLPLLLPLLHHATSHVPLLPPPPRSIRCLRCGATCSSHGYITTIVFMCFSLRFLKFQFELMLEKSSIAILAGCLILLPFFSHLSSFLFSRVHVSSLLFASLFVYSITVSSLRLYYLIFSYVLPSYLMFSNYDGFALMP